MLKKIAYIQVVLASFFIWLFYTNVTGQEAENSLSGTWANMEYREGIQKLIINADGSYVGFTKAKPTKAAIKGNCKIVEKWSDSEGCDWYKSIFLGEGGEKSFCLMKISDSGKTFEYVEDSNEFPRLFNAEVYFYRKFNRK